MSHSPRQLRILAHVAAVLLVLGLVLAAAEAGQARAQEVKVHGFLAGNGLLEHCESNEARLREICLGYITGVSDAITTSSDQGLTFLRVRACIPPAATAGQTRDVILRSIRAHPETRHFNAADLAARALAEAWPCR